MPSNRQLSLKKKSETSGTTAQDPFDHYEGIGNELYLDLGVDSREFSVSRKDFDDM